MRTGGETERGEGARDEGTATILMVDDDPRNLQLLVGILKPRGYRLRPALSAEAALRVVARQRLDLILLDIQMPEMDGYELCERLREDPRTAQVPIIFVSALDGVFDKVRAFEVGGVDYIAKPFDVEEVLARVRTHLRLHALQRSLQSEVEARRRTERELRAALSELERLAVLDALTQLANRRRLDAFLRAAWQEAAARGEAISLVMCDVDHFKTYNDRLGHQEGDRCLRRVAQVLRGVSGGARGLVARYGGEEFVLVLPGEGAAAAQARARGIVEAMRGAALPHPGSPDGAWVSVSVGVATRAPSGGEGVEAGVAALIQAADEALYEAKRRGRDRMCAAS